MFKKIIVTSILLFMSHVACAACIYLAPMVSYQTIRSGDIRYEGVMPGFTLGAGTLVGDSSAYLAGEIFGYTKSITIRNSRSGTAGLKTSWSVGGSFLPGYYFDDIILGYLRIGVIGTRFYNINTKKAGLEAGVGLDIAVTPRFDIRGEYNYIAYSTISGLGGMNSNIATISFLFKLMR